MYLVLLNTENRFRKTLIQTKLYAFEVVVFSVEILKRVVEIRTTNRAYFLDFVHLVALCDMNIAHFSRFPLKFHKK